MRRSYLLPALGLVLLGVATRLVPHPANFTAIGALALWSTTLFESRKAAFAIPLLAMLISDLVLGLHPLLLWVYGAFMAISIISLWIEPRVSGSRAVAGSLAASLLFFALTNFGVWTQGQMYPMNASGLAECFAMGIPFLKNQIAGDLFYTVLLGAAARALAGRRERALSKA